MKIYFNSPNPKVKKATGIFNFLAFVVCMILSLRHPVFMVLLFLIWLEMTEIEIKK